MCLAEGHIQSRRSHLNMAFGQTVATTSNSWGVAPGHGELWPSAKSPNSPFRLTRHFEISHSVNSTTKRTMKRLIYTTCIATFWLCSFAEAAPPEARLPEKHRAFFKAHCLDCHFMWRLPKTKIGNCYRSEFGRLKRSVTVAVARAPGACQAADRFKWARPFSG